MPSKNSKTYKLALFVVLASALVLSGAGCKKAQGPKPGGPAGEKPAAAGVQNEEAFSGTLNDLFKRGKPVRCIYSAVAANMQQQGTVYIGQGKVRTDIEMTIPVLGPKTIHALALANDQYVWNEGEKTGTKITISPEEQARLSEEAKKAQKEKTNAPDWNVKTDFKCYSWTVDNSFFVVPSDIQFTDLSELLKNIPAVKPPSGAGVQGGTVDVCALCNQMPEQVRDACRKANCK